jgi:anti-sigma factor RsiW
VSHLGDNLSALVDGELTGADLDRANAHLAACERCRGDAASLRALKNQLRELASDSGHDDLMLRLFALGDQSAAPPDQGNRYDRGDLGDRGNDYDHAGYHENADDDTRSPRRRYLVWSVLSLAVVGGVGAAAFSMGGGPSGSAPDVVPQVEMFSIQHASTTGDVPFPEPSLAARHKP